MTDIYERLERAGDILSSLRSARHDLKSDDADADLFDLMDDAVTAFSRRVLELQARIESTSDRDYTWPAAP